ncbi:ASCH domain-containing protein [Roseimaritima ulvae]|uniref:ASCH domain-containing protein n=1 Tax=Roseimaritima ulvae TaxID=980254 RepID=A0A5B9R0F9_9BACT|nr:ASCH domain-containing protein [Roseimaritima ulvae]QEG43205.1 50S ribosomal protein L22/unknown domain fusion protein [Roseimaritima ulvae]
MLLLSIRPDFAEQILDGSKQVEFRRRHPRRIELGSRMLIYASSPTRALIGTAEVFDVVEASPAEVWHEFNDVGGIEQEVYNAYYEASDRAVALRLRKPIRFDTAISLADLRCKLPGFHPPQQFAYLSAERLMKITRAIECA